MNLRILGAVMIVAGCGSVGFLMAHQYKREIHYLRQLSQVLSAMICELDYRMTPLPELLGRTAETAGREMHRIFANLSEMLTRQEAADAAACMEQTLKNHPEIPQKTNAILQQLGKNLGRFDLSGQLQGLQEVRALCLGELETLEKDRVQRIRSYQTLSLCAGAALAILFL